MYADIIEAADPRLNGGSSMDVDMDVTPFASIPSGPAASRKPPPRAAPALSLLARLNGAPAQKVPAGPAAKSGGRTNNKKPAGPVSLLSRLG